MESHMLRNGCRRAIEACQRRAFHATTRQRATMSEPIQAAAPIQFTSDRNQFQRGQPRAQMTKNEGGRRIGGGDRRGGGRGGGGPGGGRDGTDATSHPLLRRIRIVPASPSYFTATPRYTDDLLELSALLRKYTALPTLPLAEAPRVYWKSIDHYKAEVAEPVREKGFKMLLAVLKRLNQIHPSLIPEEVTQAMARFKKLVQPHQIGTKPILVDEFGRTRAVGRRKSSTASVFVVEGDGQVLVNGRTLTNYFGRLHDRESAVWGLKATQRLDKYNVWALVRGGGTTGQADAMSLGLAKALLAHEPDLKPALRKAGVITRDPRRVERKKPGKLKARKMPAWVKR